MGRRLLGPFANVAPCSSILTLHSKGNWEQWSLSGCGKFWAMHVYVPHLCITQRDSWDSALSTENTGAGATGWFVWWNWLVLLSCKVHSFIQQIFTLHLIHANHCPRHLGRTREQNRQIPCPREATWTCIQFCCRIQCVQGVPDVGGETAVSGVLGKVSHEKRYWLGS